MRKSTIFLSILIVGLTAAIYSCSKDDAAHQKQQKPQMSERHLKINSVINTFKDKMAYTRKNPMLKSGETIPADSALWYLEASINYSHGFPNEYYEEFQTDTLTITIEKNSDGDVDLEELTQKYDQMKSEVALVYNASTYTEKGLTLVDLTEVSETDNELVLSVKSITGKINPDPDTTKNNFIGNWEYGEDGGYCNSPNGLGDASEQFFERINNLIANNGKTNSFFVELLEVEVQGGDPDFELNSNVEPDNHLDYYLYYSIEGSSIPWNEDMLCIPNADMHAYNDLIYELLFDFLPSEYLPEEYGQEKYYIVSCLIFEDLNEDYPNGEHKYYHYGKFEYGIDIGYSQGNMPSEIQ